MENVLLEMTGVNKSFPGVNALQDVNFELQAGEVHALLGENGAGKSTLMKILGGIYTIDEGKIFVNGEEVQINDVKDAQKNGISIIHQEIVLVPYISIAENIFLGRELLSPLGLIDKAAMFKKAQELLDAFQLNISSNTLISKLTVAQQQMVEIIKAVSFNSNIIVMDEPTSSLSEKEVKFLFETIRNLKAKGVGIVYITHRMSELFQISDRITVLRDGLYIGTALTKETTLDKLISMMVGRELNNYYVRDYRERSARAVLKVENLSKKNVLYNASFELFEGEILGFAGLVGAGRSELMKCIFGLDRFDSGDIYVDGEKVTIKNPNDAIVNRIVYVTENRKQEGLFLDRTVQYNITIKVLNEFMRFLQVNSAAEKEIAGRYINELSVKTPSPLQIVRNLSGGNQQKVLISRWLATKPKILILDEPTRGVDVGAKAEIYAIINRLALEKVSIIMISSELPEVINMSDRIAVMYNGKVTKVLEREEFTQEMIMQFATGSESNASEKQYAKESLHREF